MERRKKIGQPLLIISDIIWNRYADYAVKYEYLYLTTPPDKTKEFLWNELKKIQKSLLSVWPIFEMLVLDMLHPKIIYNILNDIKLDQKQKDIKIYNRTLNVIEKLFECIGINLEELNINIDFDELRDEFSEYLSYDEKEWFLKPEKYLNIYGLNEVTRIVYNMLRFEHLYYVYQHKYISIGRLFEHNTETKKNLTSYCWLGKDDELDQLFEKMKHFFHIGTMKKEFVDAFTEKHVTEIKGVYWHNDNASEALFFVKSLSDLGLIMSPLGNRRFSYKLFRECIKKSNGDHFHQNLKSLKTNVEINLSQQTQNEILDIIKEFK